MKVKAQELFEPKSLYRIFNQSDLSERECFAEAEKVAFAVVTIGRNLPLEVNKLMNSGEYVDGVILDAIGSAGVEAIADLINIQINEEVKRQQLEYSKRYSPGYCHWDVKDQKIIFDLLPTKEIDVFLTDAYLMTPIKSVSFAINIGSGIKDSRWENRCRSCEDRGQCTYRMK
jgi:cobalamin-dependent methionine synthase I